MRGSLRGQHFEDVEAEPFIPPPEYLREMRADLERDGVYPVFSEGHLYTRLGKEDARFVLSIAAEYTRLIELLGPRIVKRLLGLTTTGEVTSVTLHYGAHTRRI